MIDASKLKYRPSGHQLKIAARSPGSLRANKKLAEAPVMTGKRLRGLMLIGDVAREKIETDLRLVKHDALFRAHFNAEDNKAIKAAMEYLELCRLCWPELAKGERYDKYEGKQDNLAKTRGRRRSGDDAQPATEEAALEASSCS